MALDQVEKGVGTAQHKRVRTLARGLRIMDLLKDQGPSTLTEIATQLNLDMSTVHRLVNTCLDLGFVERDAYSQRYHLGLEFLTYSNRVVRDLDIRRIALPYLERLHQNTKETLLLSVLHRGRVLWIETFRSQVHYQARLEWGGAMSFAHCTAAGKAMLAFLPDEGLQAIYDTVGFPRQTENTITSLEALRQELRRTRERGYALDNGENLARLCCIGVPIFGPLDRVEGAISMSFPLGRFTEEVYSSLVPLLSRTCQDVSRTMGASRKVILQLLVTA
jgi:IclR family KDG regulon transcriptional repressor